MEKSDYLKRLAGGGSSAGAGLSDSSGTGHKNALDRLAGGSFQDALGGRSGGGSALDRLAGGAALGLRPRTLPVQPVKRSAEGTGLYTEERKADPHQSMSGEEIYAARKQRESEAKNEYWTEFKKLLENGLTAAMQGEIGGWMKPEDQIARAEESAEAAKKMREASAAQKEAAAPIEWDGRQELLDELQELENSSGWVSTPEQATEYEQRRSDLIERLESGDVAAGNGARSYSGGDRARQIISGATKNYAAGFVNTAGTLHDFYSDPAHDMDTFSRQDIAELHAAAGDDSALDRLQEQKERARERSDEIYKTAEKIGADAEGELRRAKEGLSALGQAGVDIAENVIQMGYDAAVGYLTAGATGIGAWREAGSLGAMFVRTFGSSAQEARQAGATLEQQISYGAVKGGIEVLTEKMFDGLAGVYGAGAADDITKDVIRRLTGNRTGRALLLVLAGANEEGLEEVVSDLMSPIAEKIYREESLGELYGQLDASEILYDYLIGAAIGGMGSVVNAGTGGLSEDLSEMDLTDATEADSAGYQAKGALDVLSGRVSPEAQQARDAKVQARSERARERLGMEPGAEGVSRYEENKSAPEYLYQEHHGNILDGIRQHFNDVEGMDSVSSITGQEFQKSESDPRTLREKVIEFFDSLGNKVFRAGFGDIALNNAGVHDSLGHGYGKLKAATFASLPDVLRRGKVISYDPNFQNRGYESYLIAAPVIVGEERVYVGAYVIKDINTQRYKVHEVLTTKKDGSQSFKTEASQLESYSAAANPSKNNIPQGLVYVKESLTPEVQTAKGAGKIVNVNPANGKVQVKLSDGTSAVMSADEAGLTGPARTLFDSLKELGSSAAEAYSFYTSSMDVDGFVAAWKTAEELGEMGLKPQSVDVLETTRALPETARRRAFELGKQKAETRKGPAKKESGRADEGIDPYEGKRGQTQKTQTQAQRSGLRLERTSSEASELSSQPRKRDDADLARTRGSVSFEGGEAGGVRYKGVSDETAQHLTKKQEAAVSAAYAIAEITGFDFVFFEGDESQPKGIYKNGGTIFLNIKAGKNLGKELVAFTMSHEITHAIQEWAPEQYEALRKFIAETLMEEGKFDALVAARRKAEPNLSFTEAVDEVVANGCETMLRDSEAIKELARQNRTLFEKIGEAIDSFLEKLRTAFGEARAESPEAQALLQYAEEIQKLWDEGLKAAVANRQAGMKNAASEGGVRYSISRTRHMSVSDQLSEYRKNQFKQKDEFYLGVTPGAISASGLRANPLVMDQTDFAKSKRNKHDVPDRVWKKLPSILSDPIFSIEYADRRGFLTKDIDRGGYPLVVGIQPDVDVDSEHVNKVKTVFGVIDSKAWLERNLRHSPTIRVYDIEQANSFLNSIGYYIASRSETVRSGDIVTLKETDVKSQNSVSDTVSDRSLLLEAAEREGEKAGEELRRFARRMEELRGLQRRLERQEKKLEALREEGERRADEGIGPYERGAIENAKEKAQGRKEKLKEKIENQKKALRKSRELLPDTYQDALKNNKPWAIREREKIRRAENKIEQLEEELHFFEAKEEKALAAGERIATAASGLAMTERAEAIAALEGRIAETREEIRKKETRLDELERGAVLQREVKELRERWFSQNAEEAVQVQTEIQRENRELREALDFYRAQAKLTPVEQRRVRPQDVARFARALLKEHGSEADLDAVRQKLQAIGDYLVSGDGLNGQEYRERAREVARLIADETYVDSHDGELYKELSQRVRSTRLQISDELRGDIPDFNAWRKSQLGRLTIANDGLPINTFYQELGETYGEGLFPPDITAHSDQIQRILDVLDEQRPKPVYALTEGERHFAVRDIANEIMDVMLSGEIREDETMADRNYRRMQEITRQAREQAREAKNTLEEERAYRKELVQTRTKLIRQELQDSAEARQRRASIERLRKNLMRKLGENSGKRHVPENLKRALSAWLGTINTLSDFVSEERVRDYIEETDRVRQLAARAQDVDYGAELDLPESLADMLQQHINEAREAMKTRGGSTYHMSLEQLRSLEDALNTVTHAVNNANILLADAGHGYALGETAESTLLHLDAMRKMKDMRGWRRTAQSFLAWDNATPFYAFKRFGKGGQTIYREFVKGWSKMAMNAKQVLDFAEQLYSADYAKAAEKDVYEFELFRRIGDETDGEQSPGPYDENGKYHPENSGEAHGPKETVRVTRAQLMSLYGLLKRQQAVGHVLGAGIRVADFKGEKGGVVSQAENYILYEQDVAEMVKKLSAEDKEIVDKMIRYMSTVGSEWGNRVTMKRWGIRAFTEDSYFPIKTDKRQFDAKTPEGQKAGLYRLLNMSFTKQTVREAKNAVVLESVFDVFADHMADMAKYEALALPIVDAMRWYNYREISGEEKSGRYTTASLQKSMERAYGPEAGKYFINFLQDINGSQEGGRGEGRLKALMSNYKVAAVGANLRVAIQQPTSIARAALVLDPRILARGAAMKGGINEALKHSGLAVWKALGYFDTNINRGIREQIKHEDTLRDKVNDKAMWLAEQGDKMTWGALWNACKLEQAEKLGIKHGAAEGSEEYQKLMDATTERFEEVIVATQVMDSTVTRSQIMRSSSALVSQLAAFKSEPTLTWNALMDAWMDYRMDARKGEERALNKHGKKMRRTMAVWAFCQALTGLAAALVDACRDDDNYQTWLEKLLEHWGKNLGDNANLLSYLPFVDQLQDVLRGNKQNVMLLEGVDKTATAARILKERIWLKNGWQEEPTELTYNGKMTTWGAIYKYLQGGSFLAGLPVAGAARDIIAIYNIFGGAMGAKMLKTYDGGPKNEIKYAWQDGWLSDEEAKTYLLKEKVVKSEDEAEKLLYQWGLDGKGVYDAVKKAALADDQAAFEKALSEMEAGHYSRSDAESAVRTAIKEAYQPDEDGRQQISKQEAISMLQSYGGLSADKAKAQVQEWTCLVVTGIRYDQIDEAYKAGEISFGRAKELRQTYGGYNAEQAEATATKWRWQKEHPEYEDISESAAGKYYSIAVPAKISADEWYAFWKGTKDAKKEETVAFIQAMPITAAQKDALYRAAGYGEKDIGKTPWRTS